MPVETIVFVLAGVVVGTAAAVFLRTYFPPARSLTISTGAVSALLGGAIARAVLGSGHVLLCTAVAAVTAGLLVSVLARPDRTPRETRQALHRRPA